MLKIAVITGNRAEYGLLEPLAKEIDQDPDLKLLLFVTGSHLSPQHGNTIDEIKLPIAERIECVLSSDSSIGVSKGMGLAIISFSEALERHKPDMVIVLGDRWEILAGVIAAYNAQIPICHIHGGDVTTGSLDQGYRDSITMLSSLHLPSNNQSAYRIVEMGKKVNFVHNVGALRDDLKSVRKKKKYKFMVQFHPVTAKSDSGISEFAALLEILTEMGEEASPLIIVRPNVDSVNYEFNLMIDNFWVAFRHSKDADILISTDRLNFLKILSECECMIGNSSAGITEAPGLGVPSINIGDRQKGRVIASSTISCDGTIEGIKVAIEEVESDEFQERLENIDNPYRGGMTAFEIKELIKSKFVVD